MGRIVCKPLVEQKPPARRKDPVYLAKVRRLPCCICEAFGEIQTSKTQAHHAIHDRFDMVKAMDRFALPLCEGHHQGLRDTSKVAIHRGKETWREMYGNDFDYIAATQDRIEAMQ